MTSKNQAWADVDDEEETNEVNLPQKNEVRTGGGRYEVVRVKRPLDKVSSDGTTERVDQTYLVKKWVFPVRKQVLERKKMQKFGEVKDVPKGEHKQGDFQIESNIKIERPEEQGEIGIVSQLENMSTEKMLINKGKREFDKPAETMEPKKDADDKWGSIFKNAVRTNFSLRVTSIISYESKIEDIEADLQDYFRSLLEKHNIRLQRLRLIKTKDEPPRFLNKCILVFDTKENATKALDLIDGATYNDAILEASWAEAYDPKRRR